MESITFNTDRLIAGDIITDVVTLTAGTYYRGQPVAFDDTTGKWTEADIEDGAPLAVYLGDGRTNPRVITADAKDTIIKGGHLYEGGIVDGDGKPAALTEAQIELLRGYAIYIKRI